MPSGLGHLPCIPTPPLSVALRNTYICPGLCFLASVATERFISHIRKHNPKLPYDCMTLTHGFIELHICRVIVILPVYARRQEFLLKEATNLRRVVIQLRSHAWTLDSSGLPCYARVGPKLTLRTILVPVVLNLGRVNKMWRVVIQRYLTLLLSCVQPKLIRWFRCAVDMNCLHTLTDMYLLHQLLEMVGRWNTVLRFTQG